MNISKNVCSICGKPISDGFVLGSFTIKNSDGSEFFVHNQCTKIMSWGSKRFLYPNGNVKQEAFAREQESGKIYFAPVIQSEEMTCDMCDAKERALFCMAFNAWLEADDTKDTADICRFLKIHVFPDSDLPNIFSLYSNIKKYANIQNEKCENIIKIFWEGLDVQKIKKARRYIFSSVYNSIKNNPKISRAIFGNTLEDKERTYFYYIFNLENNDSIDIMFSRYKNDTQMYTCLSVINEWAKVLKDFCDKKISAKKAGEKMEYIFLNTL